ncbi:hypothetical protein ACROYT_G033050, partial [Oculina patagonica]
MDSLLESIQDNEEHPFCTEMMKRLDIQRRNEHFCDAILEVGSGDEQACLKAHRIVLCAASPFFYKAFNSDMKEKKEGVVRLKETSKAVMEKVLDYLYTGHVEITKENAYELYVQADFLLIPSLKALSSKFLLQTLDISNCIMAAYFALKYRCEDLWNGACDVIFANFVAVAGTEDFLNLSVEETETWFRDDEINVKEEEEVFRVIVNWMEKNQQCKDVNFLQLLRHVRCIYVSRNYAFNVMLQHPLVKASAACTKFILDAMSEVSNGTDKCFLSQPARNCLRTHEEAIVICGAKRTVCYLIFEDKLYELADMRSIHNSYSYTMSSLHNHLFVVGGRSSPSSSTADCYDPSLNRWSPTKPPETVEHCAGIATLQGFLYVVGGKDKKGEHLNTVQKYNRDTNQWQEVSPLSSPRSNVCAVADGSYLYAIGGISATGEYLDIVERFDPKKNTWDKLPSTLEKRASAGGAANRQKVFVFGGLPVASTAGDPCEMYDPDTNLWSVIANDVAPRNFARALSFREEIYVLGKFQNKLDGEENYMSLRAYDIDKNTWDCCVYLKVEEGEAFHISTLRVSKDVLSKCVELIK